MNIVVIVNLRTDATKTQNIVPITLKIMRIRKCLIGMKNIEKIIDALVMVGLFVVATKDTQK